MSHDRGCFRCFEDRGAWRHCRLMDCPHKVTITGYKGKKVTLLPGDTCTIINTAGDADMSRINPNYPSIKQIEVFKDHPAGVVVRFTNAENASIGICADRDGTFPIERIQRALDELKGPHKNVVYREGGR